MWAKQIWLFFCIKTLWRSRVKLGIDWAIGINFEWNQLDWKAYFYHFNNVKSYIFTLVIWFIVILWNQLFDFTNYVVSVSLKSQYLKPGNSFSSRTSCVWKRTYSSISMFNFIILWFAYMSQLLFKHGCSVTEFASLFFSLFFHVIWRRFLYDAWFIFSLLFTIRECFCVIILNLFCLHSFMKFYSKLVLILVINQNLFAGYKICSQGTSRRSILAFIYSISLLSLLVDS